MEYFHKKQVNIGVDKQKPRVKNYSKNDNSTSGSSPTYNKIQIYRIQLNASSKNMNIL